jgi:hypothetical protein
MSKVTQPNTTPTPPPDVARITPGRRGLLGGAQALLAGVAAVTLPRAALAAGIGPDAELIRLCDRLAANRAEWFAIMNSRHTIEDEKRTEPDNDRLLAERHARLDQIEAAPDLSTMAGAAAMARAAMADTPVGVDGHWEAREDNEWLALTVAEYVAREGVA